VPNATWDTNRQVPAATYETTPDETVHTDGVNDVTDVTPSPVVDTEGVNEPPKVAEDGMFETDTLLGALTTGNDCAEPSAAE
jgi:hypothetical protein